MIHTTGNSKSGTACPKPSPKEKNLYVGIRKVSLKKLQEIKEGKSELPFFKKIWEERKHVCAVTGERILFFDVSCFMHVLSKGAYPAFKLLDRNVLLVQKYVHTEYDHGNRKSEMFTEVNKLHDELVAEYYNPTSLTR